MLEAPPLGELDGLLAEGLELAPLLGELDAPELGGVLDAPPEADPDAEPEADPLGDFAGSDALELDELGELEAPLEGDDEELLEPELDGGGVVALPLELLLEPVAPGDADLPPPVSSPHAARPKAMAAAIANVDSFMCPPWLE